MNDGTVRKYVECQQENLKGRYLVGKLDRVMLLWTMQRLASGWT
jgi:hypothetical protein